MPEPAPRHRPTPPYDRACAALLLACAVLLAAPLTPARASGGSEDEVAEASPAARRWLEKIGSRAEAIQTLTARVRYDRIQGLIGDRQRRFGTLAYDAGPPARVSVHFKTLLVDRALRPQARTYVFDGTYLVERIEDQRQFFKRRVVEEGSAAAAPEADPLALGEGPFAVPLTSDPERVLERFTVRVVDASEGEDEASGKNVRLRYEPRREGVAEFHTADVWYDRETLLPVRARTADASENVTDIRLSGIETGIEIDPARFNLEPPEDSGWRVEIRE